MSRPWVRIAHRGASGSAPELTRAAIERALDLGVDMVEVDVQVTRDGHPVIIHDDTLERTTAGTGLVRDWNWQELRELDAGSWFSPAFASQRLLDLEGLIALVRGRARLNVEIKAPSSDWQTLLPRLLADLDGGGVLDSTVISCFDMDALRAVRRASADVRIGVLWYLPDWEGAWRVVEELGARTIHPYAGSVEPRLFAEAAARGVEAYVWTVNDPGEMRRLIAWGAAGIMSDHPELFASVGDVGIHPPD